MNAEIDPELHNLLKELLRQATLMKMLVLMMSNIPQENGVDHRPHQ